MVNRSALGCSADCSRWLSSGAPKMATAATFEDFVRANFAGDQATLDTMFNRFESLLEQLGGHMHEINREFRQQSDLDARPGASVRRNYWRL